jgi:low affinity Fe/Cu permease
MRDAFTKFSAKVAGEVGKPSAFAAAVLLVIGWGALGRFFHYSDTWQLVINTGTTIITFLMVFLIQNTQNRDAAAIHLKLDELLRGVKGARNTLIDLENMSDDELRKLHAEFHRLRLEANATAEKEKGAAP